MALVIARIYIAGISLVLLNAISTVVFSKVVKKKRLSLMLAAVLLVPFWPLAVFSEEGRKRLFITTTIL